MFSYFNLELENMTRYVVDIRRKMRTTSKCKKKKPNNRKASLAEVTHPFKR